MKLHEIVEMARIIPFPHPELDDDTVKRSIDAVRDGKVIPIEGSKFNILLKNRDYALQRASDGAVLGWMILEPKTKIGSTKVYPVANIQVLPKYRNSIAALMLVNGVRQIIDAPLCIDGPILLGGQSLLNALAKRPNIAKVFTIDKQTGERRPYRQVDVTDDDRRAVLIERTLDKLALRLRHPGGQTKLICSYFEEFHHDLL